MLVSQCMRRCEINNIPKLVQLGKVTKNIFTRADETSPSPAGKNRGSLPYKRRVPDRTMHREKYSFFPAACRPRYIKSIKKNTHTRTTLYYDKLRLLASPQQQQQRLRTSCVTYLARNKGRRKTRRKTNKKQACIKPPSSTSNLKRSPVTSTFAALIFGHSFFSACFTNRCRALR